MVVDETRMVVFLGGDIHGTETEVGKVDEKGQSYFDDVPEECLISEFATYEGGDVVHGCMGAVSDHLLELGGC